MGIPYLSHNERVDAVREHVDFFSNLVPESLDREVPTCPDWTVEGVLRHVSGGARTVCQWVNQADDHGLDSMAVLRASMNWASTAPVTELTLPLADYVGLLDSHDENLETYLLLGRAALGEQVWHATGDWGMHRHDVELALGSTPSMTPERAADLLGWLIEFLQPVVETQTGWDRPPGLRLVADDAPLDVLGS